MKAALVLLLAAPAAALHVRSDTCSCIGWKSAYTDHNVACGQGYELGSVAGHTLLPRESLPPPPPHDSMYEQSCTHFFHRISFAGCFNKKMTFDEVGDQWCYVSKECELASSKVEGTDVAIKTCSEDAGDNLMSMTAPEELNRLAGVDSLDLGVMGKFSYAVAQPSWTDVEGASGLSHEQLEQTHAVDALFGFAGVHDKALPVTKVNQDMLAAIRKSGAATIFGDDWDRGGTLILGAKTYAFTEKGMHQAGMGFVCVDGC